MPPDANLRLRTATLPKRRTAGAVLWCAFALAACQHAPPVEAPDPDDDQRPAAVQPTVPGGVFEGWVPRLMPTKRWADFEPVSQDGVAGVQVQSSGTLSLLHRVVKPPRTDVQKVAWSWWLEKELPEVDLVQADISDSPVRLLLAFDGDRDRLTGRQAMASELVRLVTGHDLPFATLTYVWTHQYPLGTVLHNPRSDRIRYMVVEQGPARLGPWVSYERDVQADFRAAFGEAPGPLVGVGLMTDTDNTKAHTRVVYGPVTLKP